MSPISFKLATGARISQNGGGCKFDVLSDSAEAEGVSVASVAKSGGGRNADDDVSSFLGPATDDPKRLEAEAGARASVVATAILFSTTGTATGAGCVAFDTNAAGDALDANISEAEVFFQAELQH